jgi:hypothetical protein
MYEVLCLSIAGFKFDTIAASYARTRGESFGLVPQPAPLHPSLTIR